MALPHAASLVFRGGALFAGLGFALTATGFGPANVHINSPYDITQSLGMESLAAVFAIAIFCANSVVRGREHQFEEIVFSTSVEKFPYLFGRFAGSFLAAFTVFSATAVGMIAAELLPLHDASCVGVFSIIPYLWTLLVLVLPGMLVAGVTLFGIATLTRSGGFALNRIVWVGFAAAGWLIVYNRFSFRLLTKSKPTAAIEDTEVSTAFDYQPARSLHHSIDRNRFDNVKAAAAP